MSVRELRDSLENWGMYQPLAKCNRDSAGIIQAYSQAKNVNEESGKWMMYGNGTTNEVGARIVLYGLSALLCYTMPPLGAGMAFGLGAWTGLQGRGKALEHNRKVEIAKKMDNILEGLAIIKLNRSNPDANVNRGDLESNFIEHAKDNAFVSKWSLDGFELNAKNFQVFDEIQEGLSSQMQLIFLTVMANISPTNRSTGSTCEHLKSTIESINTQEQGLLELIHCARFTLGECYPTNVPEKTKEQFKKIISFINGTQNTYLKNAVEEAARERNIEL